MNKVTIHQAQESDIHIIEKILLNTAKWVSEIGKPLWSAENVAWEKLSKNYQTGDFYIAYADGIPSGCMALIDYDPLFWPDVKKGESLYIHKLSVIKSARKTGIADALMDFFKAQGTNRGIKTIRLDTDALRSKTRAFYEWHGFEFVKEKVMGTFHVAFYVYNLPDTEGRIKMRRDL